MVAWQFAKENKLHFFDNKNITFTVVDFDQANAIVLPGPCASRKDYFKHYCLSLAMVSCLSRKRNLNKSPSLIPRSTKRQSLLLLDGNVQICPSRRQDWSYSGSQNGTQPGLTSRQKEAGSAVVGILAHLSLLVDPTGSFMMIFLPASQLLAELPNSHTQEREANHINWYVPGFPSMF